MPSADDAMNTAVPGTRGSGLAWMSIRNSSSGTVPESMIFDSSSRPRHHVVMMMKTPAPTDSGIQPPSTTLIALAEKKPRSMNTNGMNRASAARSE